MQRREGGRAFREPPGDVFLAGARRTPPLLSRATLPHSVGYKCIPAHQPQREDTDPSFSGRDVRVLSCDTPGMRDVVWSSWEIERGHACQINSVA